jgi:hypothetical protein
MDKKLQWLAQRTEFPCAIYEALYMVSIIVEAPINIHRILSRNIFQREEVLLKAKSKYNSVLPIFLFLFKGMAPWFKSEALWIES